MKNKSKTYNLVLAAVFSALIIAMTLVPYTGYINYGSVLEITTLHIVVILGADLLGVGYGAFLGGVWGMTCLLRALTNPLWADFLNPIISVFPRILVGVVSALVFKGLCKLNVNKIIGLSVSAILGTLTNTVFVLLALNYFGGSIASGLFETFGRIFEAFVSLNGVIELVIAVIIVPVVYSRIKSHKKIK